MTISLLDADPQLASGLSLEDRREAATRLRVPLQWAEPGRWQPARRAEGAVLGCLLLEGLVARHVQVGRASASELLGPGDIVPVSEPPARATAPPISYEWEVLQSAGLVALDERLAAEIGRWPVLALALAERVLARADHLVHLLAVSHLQRAEDRILLVLWYLADRWGRWTREGVAVPLRLTHRALGELAGAQRATVTLALRQLQGEGMLSRRRDGTWLLHGEPPS